MIGAVRQGQVLGRVLRSCSARSIAAQITRRPAKWQQLSSRISPLATRTLHSTTPLTRPAHAEAEATEQEQQSTESNEPITRFQELADRGLVSEKIIRNITGRMGIETMTEVQSMTINATLNGADTLAQAKTGTGKTLAFLLPVLQNIFKDPTLEENRSRFRQTRSSASDIRAIVISPTRELAEQIAVEARKIAGSTGVIVQTAVGGTMKREGLRKIQREGCHILVGTPGRLHDIFSDPYSGVSAPKLSAFVLDEADRLLDIGFAPVIADIQQLLPARTEVDRQTLMFSATIPGEVLSMVRQTMKPSFKFVKGVEDNEEPTHMTVPQKAVFVHGLENQLPAVLDIAKQGMEKHQQDPSKNQPFKAIVYFNSTAEVNLAYQAFQELRSNPDDRYSDHALPGVQIVEMHSRLTQAQRTRNSDQFRRSKSGILFSSDVTARGMDFPNVTHVIQVGVARDRESYVHRLGRTARANKTGEGWILLSDLEYRDFKSKLGDLPIKEDSTSVPTAHVDMTQESQQLSPSVATTLTQVGQAFKKVPFEHKGKAYQACLGIFGHVRDKNELIRSLNNMAQFGWRLPEAPGITSFLARKLGLDRVKGVNISERDFNDSRGMGRGSDGPRGSRGGRAPSGRDSRYGGGGYGRSGSGYGGGGSRRRNIDSFDF
ncbi:hypothetical protein FQN54_000135 [Arachnomyces sp. PD_36]|nr:hypothetical protein FQN54_000135 [Arachnomyces sp. PD_36]